MTFEHDPIVSPRFVGKLIDFVRTDASLVGQLSLEVEDILVLHRQVLLELLDYCLHGDLFWLERIQAIIGLS